jgi:hypothetical protein
MKKYWILLLIWFPLFSCEDEIPDFNPTVEHLYDGLFKVWSKKSIIRNLQTGAISINESVTWIFSIYSPGMHCTGLQRGVPVLMN